MKHELNIWVVGGDLRQEKLSQLLAEDGHTVHTYALGEPQDSNPALTAETSLRRIDKADCNERLEFLGDAVLEIVTSEFLFHRYPRSPEGELTRMRASIVCEPTLAFCTRELDLGRYLLLGKGEAQTGGRERKSVLSDVLEALIGAIYLDGGFANATEFVHRFV